jgi:group II intron reverse transcriptase/maturase
MRGTTGGRNLRACRAPVKTGEEERMKEPHGEDPASHSGPESCAADGNGGGEALTGENTGRDMELRNQCSEAPTLLREGEGHTADDANGKPSAGLAESKTLSMCGHSPRGNRESREAFGGGGPPDRSGKAQSLKPGVYASRQSHDGIVPAKRPNNGGRYPPPAEAVEGRPSTKGNAAQAVAARTQGRGSASAGLWRVREAARRDKRLKFTALLHHVTVDLLREGFLSLKRQAAPGVDGVTWAEYEVGLENRLRDLHARVHRGAYRAQPSKRTYIPKADGKRRPLGIAAVEDKVVQQAVVTVLNSIYETDFVGFSYGFRPGRNPHQALDALWVALTERPVNWVLDADIQGFFDTLNHEWLLTFLEHRIADRRILRLVAKWLRAGISEDGEWRKTEVGTPQGAVISPLLANVYLHYVFDLWVKHWRKSRAQGAVVVVRYADDFVLGFQHRHEAQDFLADLRVRLEKFGLKVHPDKTRLLEFGRFAARDRQRRGEGKPETFDFLGFTHHCARTLTNRKFTVLRRTTPRRLRAAMKAVRGALHRRRHEPVKTLGRWLGGVIRGYLNYHAVPGNGDSMEAFRREAVKAWLRALRRRGQKHRLTWARLKPLVQRWIPTARIVHPYPNARFHVRHPR